MKETLAQELGQRHCVAIIKSETLYTAVSLIRALRESQGPPKPLWVSTTHLAAIACLLAQRARTKADQTVLMAAIAALL
jgi:hypothetical protein